jgi:hypothetical protein
MAGRRSAAGQNLHEAAVDFSIHDQTDMPARHLSGLVPGIKVSEPVNDSIFFGEDRCNTNTWGKREKIV